MLVLLNGKRRHGSALIHVNTSVGRGNTGTDMNAIPMGAIKRIEVLRDGASAQYGSDAIAGVINVILKDDYEGGFRTNYGTTYKGDGDQFVASLDKGSMSERTARCTRRSSIVTVSGPTGLAVRNYQLPRHDNLYPGVRLV